MKTSFLSLHDQLFQLTNLDGPLAENRFSGKKQTAEWRGFEITDKNKVTIRWPLTDYAALDRDSVGVNTVWDDSHALDARAHGRAFRSGGADGR